MYRKKKKSNWKFYVTFSIVSFFMVFFFANEWVESMMEKALVRAIVHRQIVALEKVDAENRRRLYTGKVVRKILMNPNRTFAESRIYSEGKLLAQFNTIRGDEVKDLKGELPEGKVKFVNESKNTHGVEYYQKGKRHGRYVEYYDNGEVYRRAKFYRGDLMENTIYYFDGTPRRIEDFKDALRFVDDPEIGYGRIFYRNGTLMYEWRLTNLLKGGYKKSYNRDGELVEEKIYDNIGDLVEIINYGFRATDPRYNK